MSRQVSYTDFNDETTDHIEKLIRVFADINLRLGALEDVSGDLRELEQRYGSAALERINAVLLPVVSSVEQTLANVAAELEILKTGTAPNADKLGGLDPSHYLDLANASGAAPDAVKLGGQDPAHYLDLANANGTAPDAAKLGGEDPAHYKALGNATGVLPFTKGGTGANSKTAAKTALEIDKVDNTPDDEKPVSQAQQDALDLKINKSNAGILAGWRNKLINGNFDFWVYGNSQTGNGYGSDNRWVNDSNGSTKIHSRQAFTLGQTDVPGQPKFYSRTVVTSVAGASNYVLKTQRIEDVGTLAGEKATVTFWAKADTARNIAVSLGQGFGTGGSPSPTEPEFGITTCNLTTDWQKFSFTVDVPNINGKTLGTNDDHYLYLLIWFEAGSNYDGRTNSLGQQSGTFDIARVSVVEGDATTEEDPTSPRQIGQEEALCQRYYEASVTELRVLYTAAGASYTYSNWFNFAVRKRGSPTLTIIKGTGNNLVSDSADTIGPDGFAYVLVATSGGPGVYRHFMYKADSEI